MTSRKAGTTPLKLNIICACATSLTLDDIAFVELDSVLQAIWYNCRHCRTPGVLFKAQTRSETWDALLEASTQNSKLSSPKASSR